MIYAALNRFYKHAIHHGIYLNETPFTISYDTTIPRQVGLSGSSSIVIATLRALMQYYRVPVVILVRIDCSWDFSLPRIRSNGLYMWRRRN